MDSIEQVLKELEEGGDRKVRVAITDIDGVLRGKFIHIDKLRSALSKGFGFCDVVFGWDCADVCYDNVDFTGWHTGYPDAHAVLDPQTFRRIPWEDGTPLLLADFEDKSGNPLAVCPRQLLKTIIKRLERQGLTAMMGFEFEWFNFTETAQTLADKNYVKPTHLTPGMFGYSMVRSSDNYPYFDAIMEGAEEFGIPIEGLHTETGPGVYEAALQCSEGVSAADRAVLFKTAVKQIAGQFGILPTFMAKVSHTLPGCSGHLHQSLLRDGKNIFYDAKAKNGMSKALEHYLAGQMLLLPEILPFFAPTINSYKRLVEGMWAPTRVTWGIENRTVALRVIPAGASATRLETRVGGADLNPYLAAAAALAAGLYGMENKLTIPTKAITGNGYEATDAIRLPLNLEQAAMALGKSKIARELFSDPFVDHFVNTRLWEWKQYQSRVTNWETERYFEII